VENIKKVILEKKDLVAGRSKIGDVIIWVDVDELKEKLKGLSNQEKLEKLKKMGYEKYFHILSMEEGFEWLSGM